MRTVLRSSASGPKRLWVLIASYHTRRNSVQLTPALWLYGSSRMMGCYSAPFRECATLVPPRGNTRATVSRHPRIYCLLLRLTPVHARWTSGRLSAFLSRGDLSSPPAVGSLFAGYPAERNTNFAPGLTAPLILVNAPSAVIAHWQVLRLRPPFLGHHFPVSGAPFFRQFLVRRSARS